MPKTAKPRPRLRYKELIRQVLAVPSKPKSPSPLKLPPAITFKKVDKI